MTLWLVRAGSRGEREEFALKNKVAVIGWEELPDLSSIEERHELHKILQTSYPDEKINTLRNWEGQIWQFIHEIKIGDKVALPLKQRAFIAFGEVVSKYQYEPKNPPGARHVISVNKWQELPRKSFDPDILFSFGAFKTVCQIQRNKAENRVAEALSGKKDIRTDDREEDIDVGLIARDQIVNYIERKFKGDKLAFLVDAILTAQGFKTRVSPKGADGGVHILAGKGAFGFEVPRIAVQVKSFDDPIDIKVFNELQGSMTNFGADQGLIVTWGGYKNTVEKEAARHFFKMKIWDANTLVQMIQDNYENLSEEIQAELPLKQIWALVPEDEE
jgi:restriction system protein